MSASDRMHRIDLSRWLDQPVHTLKARAGRLKLPAAVALVINMGMVVGAQLASTQLTSAGGVPSGPQLAVVLALALAGPLAWILVELITTAGVLFAEEDQTPELRALLGRAFQGNVLSAVFVRLLVHVACLGLTVLTCGTGIVAWLAILMYLPLVVPCAMREGVGGYAAVRRSQNLLWWRPSGGPALGSGDRVVVAFHVVVGLTYAVQAIPTLPSMVWSGIAMWGLVADGSFDPSLLQDGSLQAQLTPPIWLTLPVQLLTSMAGLTALFYSQQLFLDLHQDLTESRDGVDFDRTLDCLEAAAERA